MGSIRFGIKVTGFSSDGNTRLLKTMRLNSVLPISNGYETSKTTKSASESKPRLERMDKSPEIRQLNEWKWYQIRCDDEECEICFVQDIVHILTKLKVRLLNLAVTLHMGNYIAGNNHLQALARDVSKDQHLLTATDLKGEDKMNFEAVEKMCLLKVIDHLKKKYLKFPPKRTKKIKTTKRDDTSSKTEEEDKVTAFDDSTDTEVFDSNKSDDDSDYSQSVIETQVGDALETKRSTKVEVTNKTDELSVDSFVFCSFIYNQGTKMEKQKKFIAQVIKKEKSNITVSCMRYNEKRSFHFQMFDLKVQYFYY
ncbi:unnamed protein product [Psylliodes chrysocephalus]|uniref:Uncharacterized protein n=1 Tax=Psylliodes chrysocephalus TaxID=3402493 RepID=A0A9P0D721_9CUCU|nr:unnamed protein product [Psylliodes chrysocephala]